ncbi:MAG: T9SS type A sorting domain-containing protein [Bacteroidetes bacterium]|nr:T9SS type A sorting domain-containing protein [Bacteroidota bacterium]
MKKFYASVLVALFLTSASFAADVTKKGEINSNETWSKDNTYFLDGYVIITDGATVTIEAGTVIKGLNEPSTGDLASALVVARGGKLIAEGTASSPIIFTSEFDDVKDKNDLDLTKEDECRGLWGGVILLGKAPLGDNNAEATIEGLPVQDNTKYGGTVENDNSGSLRYVSIRHGGSELAPDEEINGLTLGGVGNATTLEHIEVLYNSDDGIEFFGGSVNLKWAVVGFCGDDGFDWDKGWQGKGQFWFCYGGTDAGDHGGELDGASPDDNARYVNSTVYNFTFIGGWDGKKTDAKNEHAILMRDGTGGTLANGIVTGYNNYALQVEDRGESFDSYSKMKDGKLNLLNNIWFEFGAGSSWNDVLLATPEKCTDCSLVELKKELTDNNNELTNPGIDRKSWVPNRWSLAATKTGAAEPSGDNFFTNVDYIGAFEPESETSWLTGWTAFDQYVGPSVSVKKATIETGIYPNPASNVTTISFIMKEAGQMNISIVDLQGKVVATVASQDFAAGNNSVNFNTSGLEAGIYMINFINTSATSTAKLIIE